MARLAQLAECSFEKRMIRVRISVQRFDFSSSEWVDQWLINFTKSFNCFRRFYPVIYGDEHSESGRRRCFTKFTGNFDFDHVCKVVADYSAIKNCIVANFYAFMEWTIFSDTRRACALTEN